MLKWEDVVRLAIRLNGVPVHGCRPGSPAALAGVQYGDILLAVNDVPTPDWAAYIEARALDRSRMRIEVFRQGANLVFDLVLPATNEPIDHLALLEELIEGRTLPLASGEPRREPEPS